MAELPIADFIRTRLFEYDSNFEVRKGSAYDTLVFKPLQFVLQPFRDEADELFIAQSLRRILQQEDPDAFNEELVDDLVANVFVTRNEGDRSSGIARLYYAAPVNREYPTQGLTVVGNNGKNYTNPSPYSITAEQMSAQIENGLYYFDIAVTSEDLGSDTELDPGGLVSVPGDEDLTTVTNKSKIQGGQTRETNTQLIERARNAITVRDLVTGKGFSATLFENFPSIIREIQAVGFGDKEMMRDILFNAHVGGKHDGWVKTANVTQKSADFIGVLIDTTRATRTSAYLALSGTAYSALGEVSLDRVLGDAPLVTEVKPYVAAEYVSPVDMSSPLNLAGADYVKMTIDGTTRIVKVSGSTPATTSRNEILIAINRAFGVDVAFAFNTTIKLISPTAGTASSIILADPDDPGQTSGLVPVFGDPAPAATFSVSGDGPIEFIENTHYEIDDANGQIRRIIPIDYIVSPGDNADGEVNGISGTIPWVGQQTVEVGTDSVVLERDECLIPAALADPAVGDTLIISDSISGNDGYYTISEIALISLGGTDNYRKITANRWFFGTEDAGSSPVQVTFPTARFTSVDPWFASAAQFDILTVVSGPYAGDYRILEVVSPTEVILDSDFLEYVDFSAIYYVRRTGIKENELVYVEYYYNPLSIDIGKYVKLDEYGRERGIRPGREDFTITDVAFLKVNSIEIIDPISRESLGEVLRGEGGYGRGGYGEGAYGIGSGSEYYLRVNEPTARFSALEDSYLVINSGYQGFSFRVNYDCVPEIETIHDFCRSDRERVLDGDILVKHFIPAYVSGTISYRVDETDSSIPSNEDLLPLVKTFINERPANQPLEISDVAQYILSVIDPYRRYGGAVYPMTLEAEIHNTDGSTTILSGSKMLEVIEEEPFPLETTRPLTARTVHWLAGDIVLSREE